MKKTSARKLVSESQHSLSAETRTSPAPAAAIQRQTGTGKALTTAQKEYLEGMRVSVKQMKTGDARPLTDLLDELREERKTDVEANPHDQEV